MKSWTQIKTWRRAKRSELVEQRVAMSRDEKQRARSLIVERIMHHLPEIGGATIGFYWPIKGEIDLRGLIGRALEFGAEAGLPVIIHPHQPVEFRSWTPTTKMAPGFWSIPVPQETEAIRPTLLFVPLVGFDANGYRLGYGGGYYDRTLAPMSPRPIAIGVGYERCRLASIYPQAHDVPMSAVVTENEFRWHEAPRSVIRSGLALSQS